MSKKIFLSQGESKIIDGKALADKLGEELKEKLAGLKERPLVVSILIGNDPNSLLYTQMKQKKADEFDIDFMPVRFKSHTPFETVARKIQSLNEAEEVKGIMIQLPIPKEFLNGMHKSELINLIDPRKDIDGMVANSPFLSATVKGVMKIIENLKLKRSGARAGALENLVFGVVGSEGEVGKPLIEQLAERGAKEILRLDKRNPECDLNDLKRADVVISCTGVQGLIDAEMVKNNAILIDVGLGDFEPETYKKAKAYTPKSGGVGPMTIYSLMENILEAAKKY